MASLSCANSQDFLNDTPLFSAPYNGDSLSMLILQMKNFNGHMIFMSINHN